MLSDVTHIAPASKRDHPVTSLVLHGYIYNRNTKGTRYLYDNAEYSDMKEKLMDN